MEQVIYTKKNQCQDCYKCLRQCPVKAIKIIDGHAEIIDDLCIACGNCVKVCPVNAKKIRDDKANLLHHLSNHEKIKIAIVAPSYVGDFGPIDDPTFIYKLKQIGFDKVTEASIGAEILLQNSYDKNKISTSCPVVIDYINKYGKGLNAFTEKKQTPLEITANYLKSIEKNSIIAFIGPCPAKKRESDKLKNVDVAVTFDELREIFDDSNINLYRPNLKIDNTFFPFQSKNTIFYGFNNFYNYAEKVSVTGIKFVIEQLKLCCDNPIDMELYSCEGGCINGPTTDQKISIIEKYKIVRDRFKERKDCDIPNIDYDLSVNSPLYNNDDVVYDEIFSEKEIKDQLISVGKKSREDELNCSSCGYNSCRDFAVAMLQGKAESTMCVSYMKKIATNKANMLIKTMPAGVVIVDKDMRILESNEAFAKICGETIYKMYMDFGELTNAMVEKFVPISKFLKTAIIQKENHFTRDIRVGDKIISATIFCVEENKTACAVLLDITQPKFKKQEIIKRTQTVIEKNLETVQKIAYLLGENAAETETVLNSIIDAFAVDKI